MQKSLVEDDVLEENQKVLQFNQGINLDNAINMDDFPQSFDQAMPLYILHL
jgi:hypothetical protein